MKHAGGGHPWRLAFNGHDPAFSPSRGRVVYAGRDRHGIDQIFTVRPDGQDRRALTSNTGGRIDYASPCYSPDGSEIVFQREVVFRNFSYTDIFRMRADGSHLVRLTHGKLASAPAWGPSAP